MDTAARRGRATRLLLLVTLAASLCGVLFYGGRQAAGGFRRSGGQTGMGAAVAPSHVLVVMNAASDDSRAIADDYLTRRGIPPANLLRVVCPTTDEWTLAGYRASLENAVRARTLSDPDLEYVVLTRGVPFRIRDYGEQGGLSTDSYLATCLVTPRPAPHSINPCFAATTRFRRARYGGLLLVTRLDGTSRAGAIGLTTSALGAKPARGPFYLRDSFCMDMEPARDTLAGRGFQVRWIQGFNNPRYPRYQDDGGPFMAHWGAGPHDTQYTEATYQALRFLPGALCDLTWSTSAAGLRDPHSVGSIAAMTERGAAGAQGYVSEPFCDAISKPDIVLDRYTRGYNLAESFWMGSMFINWKQVVLGDPLCAPYAQGDHKP